MLSTFIKRNVKTSEIIISKIFPAGCGWQSGSIIAENLSYTITDPMFYTIVGFKEALFVGSGHMIYYKIKSYNSDEININDEKNNALLLSSATFCSGYMWQPIVNQYSDMDFLITSTITGTYCSSSFLGGLLLSRLLYPMLNYNIEKNNKETIKKDVGLSLSIGGATGLFVATDTELLNNFLANYLGINDNMSTIECIYTAGISTSLGFFGIQTLQNVLKKNWLD